MSSKKIVIIDYGSGNLRSVYNALRLIKAPADQLLISSDYQELNSASHIILPGVGSFADCVSGLRALDRMEEKLREEVLVRGKPFLGICVGMQILADYGEEHGRHSGLGFIKGYVTLIDDQSRSLKIPHIGWNDLKLRRSHPLLQGIETGQHAYFVHSYQFICDNQNDVLAEVEYGGAINAIIAHGNIMAVQFHPEKSAELGAKLLKNFIST